MTIALTSDHTGYDQLKQLRIFLESMGHACHDFGPQKLDKNDDYPKLVGPAAKAVASGECQRGIILGGSGQGEAMAANRIEGVRCAVFYGPAVPRRAVDAEGHASRDPYEIVKLSRQHNDANMLSLAARFVGLDEMKHVVMIWLETPFSGVPRHERRIEELDKI